MHLYRYMYDRKYVYYTKPHEVDRTLPSVARLRIAARAIFGPPGNLK